LVSKLDELKSSPDVGQPEYTASVCLSAKLAAELEAADTVLFNAEAELEAARAELDRVREQAADGSTGQGPRRSGQTPHQEERKAVETAEAQAEEAAAVSDDIRGRMESVSVTLTLRANTEQWGRWVGQHPPRMQWERTGGTDEAPAGQERPIARDQRLAGGICDIDALVAELHRWIARYDDEEPSDEWWDMLTANGVPADMAGAAQRVVQMHVQGVDLGKSRTAWRRERTSGPDSK
jgi:hypothetical protein